MEEVVDDALHALGFVRVVVDMDSHGWDPLRGRLVPHGTEKDLGVHEAVDVHDSSLWERKGLLTSSAQFGVCPHAVGLEANSRGYAMIGHLFGGLRDYDRTT